MLGGHATSEVTLGSQEPGQGAPTRLGPLVRRAVHHGAAIWLVAVVQFVLAMIIVQLAWSGPPGYSLTGNHISDLGNTACGPWPSSTSPRVCSPWHDVFDGSAIVLGALVMLGAVLVRSAFPRRGSSTLGLALVALAGIGAIGVGASPENVHLGIHLLSSVIAFVGGSLALVVLGVAMLRDTRWDGYRLYTALSGLVGIVAFGLFEGHLDGALGGGGMERLIVAPILLWLAIASIHLLRVPQFAPHGIPTS